MDNRKEYMRAYWLENKKKLSSQHKLYREENYEKVNAQRAEYRKENKENIKEQSRRYYEANIEAIRKRSKKCYGDKEKIAAYKREWNRKNREKIAEYYKRNKLKYRLYARNYKILKKRSGYKITESDINNLYVSQRGKCFYCDKQLDVYEIEHIIPLSKGGEHKLYNVVLSCRFCNSKKRDKSPEIFVNEILTENKQLLF